MSRFDKKNVLAEYISEFKTLESEQRSARENKTLSILTWVSTIGAIVGLLVSFFKS